ncbi:MAG: BolA family transcriptional regulator [Robiginitomaculum sp.]|nr:MAG: BolA family transcriptional regulator [Robiginitomaculum sp.]
MGLIAATIKEKLTKAFNPLHLEVIDESYKHAGHAGAHEHATQHGAGESHFHVIIVSAHFADLNILARHRAVMEVLSAEMDGKVHALSLDAKAPAP